MAMDMKVVLEKSELRGSKQLTGRRSCRGGGSDSWWWGEQPSDLVGPYACWGERDTRVGDPLDDR